MPNTYVIIGVLFLLLAGAGYAAYYQTKEVSRLSTQLDVKEKEIETITLQAKEAKDKSLTYYSEIQRLEAESLANRKRTAKDLTRVAKISKERASLYVKLVNKDYEKLTSQLEDLSK